MEFTAGSDGAGGDREGGVDDVAFAFHPGSLTILLNFGPDGKAHAQAITENEVGAMRKCPQESVLETATNKCRKLACPSGTTIAADGSCVRPEDPDNLIYETHIIMDAGMGVWHVGKGYPRTP
jgi:hypothetical protein